MTTILNTYNLIPLTSDSAYSTAVYNYTASVVGSIPNSDIVDWVLVELRTGTTSDVVVTDGFVGNVVIKLAEGLASGLFRTIAREIAAIDPALAERFKPVQKRIYALHDYHEHGGAPLLGVNGVCIICHGSSEARTITNAILKSRHMVDNRVNQAIVNRLAQVGSGAGVG